ncbi:unnamed protein product [Toxocara canis]|uniref:Poly [ADP-ribose] polymerase n=1 Tax=Toxocara canis TaxID=6265 RepID=A0A183U2B3_TOXCA|nr:unnamed protein product [Toxocara canis]
MSWEYYKRITLVIHVDYSYLDDTILYQVNTWDGPVSLAIVLSAINLKEAFFATKEKGNHESAGFVCNLPNSKCIYHRIPIKVLRYAAITKEKLSVHLIYRWPVGCEKTNLEPDVPLPSVALYPANVARNVARMVIFISQIIAILFQLSRSKYLLIADYAHIFSINFESQMLKLAEDVLERDPKTVLVFRIFEAKANASSVPRDRRTLYESYKKGEAIVFHGRYNPGAHTIPNLDGWFKRNITYDQPALSFTLP